MSDVNEHGSFLVCKIFLIRAAVILNEKIMYNRIDGVEFSFI